VFFKKIARVFQSCQSPFFANPFILNYLFELSYRVSEMRVYFFGKSFDNKKTASKLLARLFAFWLLVFAFLLFAFCKHINRILYIVPDIKTDMRFIVIKIILPREYRNDCNIIFSVFPCNVNKKMIVSALPLCRPF